MTTKRQHLIWRKYLAPWTDNINTTDGSIYWYNKDKKEIISKTNIEDVGVQGYTYDISMLNDDDRRVIQSYYEKWLKTQSSLDISCKLTNSLEILERDYIENTFIREVENNGISILEELYNCKFPFEGPTTIEKVSSILEKELFDSIMTGIQTISDQELCSLYKQVLEKSNEEDKRYTFYEFLSVQMLRTWRTKDVVFNAKNETINKFENSCLKGTSAALFPLMMVVNSQIIATTLCKHNFYIEILNNQSTQNFITGDYPIINLFADYSKTDENIDKWELYYPISPKIAIICKNTIGKNIITPITDNSIVDTYNEKIFNAATKQVYAASYEDLFKYKPA